MDHSEHHDYSQHMLMNHSGAGSGAGMHDHSDHHGSMEHSLQDHTMNSGGVATGHGGHGHGHGAASSGGMEGMVHHMISKRNISTFHILEEHPCSSFFLSHSFPFLMSTLWNAGRWIPSFVRSVRPFIPCACASVAAAPMPSKTINNNPALQRDAIPIKHDSPFSHPNSMVGEVIHKQPRPTMLSVMHLFQTFLHIVQVTLSFLLMLIFMTYNTWLCLAVVLGAALGYFLFGWKKSVIVDVTEHCH
ncbi:high-affinity copper uptake protein [Culex quinquefasciatus]|uniref:Copper transport protein n=1 Tax=Culex quinquefasciatus TaxID=7176 RepID=B0XGR1_CULQU|nr:high-affinity copper uptake protein [Culex quinquefasciatus]|eukprot:XP_001868833.1 high-affinity copper uptake protein [Culex quinquefasciatus]